MKYPILCMFGAILYGAMFTTVTNQWLAADAAAPDNTDPRITRIVDRAIAHEKWCRESVRLGLMTREDWEADADAASLLDERERECK